MLARLCLLFTLIAAPIGAEEKKPKPDSLVGRWEVVSGVFDGQESAGLKGRILAFGEKEFTTYEGGKKGRTVAFTLDLTTTPKGIDLERGSDGSKAMGIYVIDKDELKICYGEPGAARPKKFDSAAGEKVFLLTLKRAKSD